MGAPRERKAEAMRGTMLYFNSDKDFGLIAIEGGDRVGVHSSGFASGAGPTGRCSGTPVEFRVTARGGEDVATDVTLVQEISPRRARRRSR